MNHSVNGQASTARCVGRGRASNHCSIFSTHRVLIVRQAITSPAASTAASVTVHLCRSTPTNDLKHPVLPHITTVSVYGAKKLHQAGESVTALSGPYTVLRSSNCSS